MSIKIKIISDYEIKSNHATYTLKMSSYRAIFISKNTNVPIREVTKPSLKIMNVSDLV